MNKKISFFFMLLLAVFAWLTGCRLSSIDLAENSEGKYVTFSCGNVTEDVTICTMFLDSETFKPLTDKRKFEADKIISVSSQKVYPDDGKYKEMLDGRFAVHMSSGVVFYEGSKYRLENLPYIENGEYMVPQEVIEKAFSAAVVRDGTTITVGASVSLTLGQNKIKVGNKEETILCAPVEKGGILYLPLAAIAEKGFSKELYYNDTTKNGGMVIIGDSVYSAPSDTDTLQELNDFLFFPRPSRQEILDDYKESAVCGVHPRIMLTPAKVTKLKSEIALDDVKKSFYSHLDMRARQIVNNPPDILQYELTDGGRLMDVADEFEGYMLILGLAYQLKGDAAWKKKFADAAWRQIEAVASFKDWNPAHHIDVGMMAFGFAIAYEDV